VTWLVNPKLCEADVIGTIVKALYGMFLMKTFYCNFENKE